MIQDSFIFIWYFMGPQTENKSPYKNITECRFKRWWIKNPGTGFIIQDHDEAVPNSSNGEFSKMLIETKTLHI